MKVDLILKNINYLNVKEKKFVKGNISINNGKISGINTNDFSDEEITCDEKYLVPGFIDGHIHLESSIISPDNFAKLVSLHGTTCVITDPHEIANVCGIDGIKWMLQKTENLPIDVYFMISSCVPATPFDESAYTLNSNDVEKCFQLDKNRILGLAEMMNYPGVIAEDEDIMKKINKTLEKEKRVDGHSPGLTGENLIKYIKAGISSDHECSTLDEAIEKLNVAKSLNQDFYIMIREGTAAKNLKALAPLMNMKEYENKLMFATDDKHPEELSLEGHIDSIIRKAISLGISPELVYTVATYNAAKYFGLKDIGSIEVGKKADLIILNNEKKCDIHSVYKNGELITKEKLNNWKINQIDKMLDKKVRNSIHINKVTAKNFECKGDNKHIIELIPGEIVTKDAGTITDYDIKNDIIKVVVIESHKGTMHTRYCIFKRFRIKKRGNRNNSST